MCANEHSKHMDKHDRPYKCTVPGCEKLLGFTYSGGLLRHEREVHKMHGGTKEPLFCPHNGCKRSSGEGFTRRENLSEHIRRVHHRASGTPASVGADSSMVDRGGRRSLSTAATRREVVGSGIRSPSADVVLLRTGESNAMSKKRRRDEADDDDNVGGNKGRSSSAIYRGGRGVESEGGIDENDDTKSDTVRQADTEDDLRGEVKRLRRELDLKDAQLYKLQTTVDKLSRSSDKSSPER